MRNLLKLILLLIIPIPSFAQDTTRLKHQAEMVANAFIKNDYATVIDYTYPKLVAANGGKEKMIQLLKNGVEQANARGFTFAGAIIGSPGKFYKAGTEIHCLVPEMVVMTTNGSRLVNHANLLAITKDGGVKWYFLDINPNTYKAIPKLFPNFNKKLIIPEPTRPGLQ